MDENRLTKRLRWMLCIATGIAASVASAPQGQLDVSFGSSGKRVIPFDIGGAGFDGAFDIAIQTDGRIVVAGGAEKLGPDTDFAAVRLEPDGSLDPSFGTGGKATVWFDLGGTNSEYASAVAIRPDGGIFLAGPVTGLDGDRDFGVALLDSSGSLDSNFGLGGKAVKQFDLGGGHDDWAWDLALQPDGKILVAGSVDGSAGNVDFGVARFNPVIGTDLSFGFNGIRVIFFDEGGSDHDDARAVALQPDGKIVLAGTVSVGDGTSDIGVVRLNSNSTNDMTFGNGGKLTIAFDIGGEEVDIATDVALQQDGGIVVVGAAEAANSSMDFAIARLLPDGTLDHSFDGDGKATVSFDLGGDLDDSASAVAINADGAILVAGSVDGPAGSRDFGLARLDSTGALDPTFGSAGKTTVAFDQGSGFDDLYGLAVPPTGGIFVAGGVHVVPNGIDFGVAKVTGSVVFVDGFECNPENEFRITDFFTEPVDPAPGQSYTATARIACAPANTQVAVSVASTDGFWDSTQCTITGSGACSLGVPGRAAGVQDVITATVAGGPRQQIQIIF